MAQSSLTRKYIEMKQRLLGEKKIMVPSLTIPTENLCPTYGTLRTPQSIRSTAKSCDQSILHTSRNEPQEQNHEINFQGRTPTRPLTAKHSLNHRNASSSLTSRAYQNKPNNLLLNSVGFTVSNKVIVSPTASIFQDRKQIIDNKTKHMGINSIKPGTQPNPSYFQRSDERFMQEKYDEATPHQTKSIVDKINNIKDKVKPQSFNLQLQESLKNVLKDIPHDLLKKSSTRFFEEGSNSYRSQNDSKTQENGPNSTRTYISQKSGDTSTHLARLMSSYNPTANNSPKYRATLRNKGISRLSSFAGPGSCSPRGSIKQENYSNSKRIELEENDCLALRLGNPRIFPSVNLTPRDSPSLDHPMTKRGSILLTPRSGRNTPSICDQSFQQKDRFLLGYNEKEDIKSRKSFSQYDRKISTRKKSRKVSSIVKLDQPKEPEPQKEAEEEGKLKNIEQRNIGMPSQMNKLFQETKEIQENINIALRDLEIKQIGMQQALFAGSDYLKVNQQMLNEIDLQLIATEFEKKARGHEEVNYKALDGAMKNLKFFIHLPYHLRLEILRNSTFARYPPKQVLFREGDFGDMVYIILRGSVNVRSNKSTIFGIIAEIIVTVLYDGTCFGDYAVMGTSQKSKQGTQKSKDEVKEGRSDADLNTTHREDSVLRKRSSSYFESSKLEEAHKEPRASIFQEKTQRMATIEIAESCDILCIPRKQFQNIFLRLVQKEIDDKLRVLASLPCFQDLDPFTLIPVANNLIPRVYSYKQVIISRGDPVDKLMIIARGKCGLVLQTARAAPLDPPPKIKGRKANLRQFKVGLTDYIPQDISEPEQEKKDNKNPPNGADTRYTTRSFNYDRIGVVNNNLIYTDNIHFGVLTEGSNFGGRALLSDQDLQSQKFLAPRNVDLDEPARLSVLADSVEVEILELDAEHMKYIPEFIQQILKNGLMNTREFDDYDVDSEIKALTEWGDLKERNLRDVFQSIERPYGSHYKKF